ncbi:hypothetical protein AYI68_g3916 [Smittium mucronatum]|uniref:Uncharacterized protein n=1 Tax=Smittium mucronatum TaxID=133383 RepID=A0A1R0GYJ6_9FUNG|nr:hypothetical protein AYI68_g3916 [Smittium mucronatum]
MDDFKEDNIYYGWEGLNQQKDISQSLALNEGLNDSMALKSLESFQSEFQNKNVLQNHLSDQFQDSVLSNPDKITDLSQFLNFDFGDESLLDFDFSKVLNDIDNSPTDLKSLELLTSKKIQSQDVDSFLSNNDFKLDFGNPIFQSNNGFSSNPDVGSFTNYDSIGDLSNINSNAIIKSNYNYSSNKDDLKNNSKDISDFQKLPPVSPGSVSQSQILDFHDQKDINIQNFFENIPSTSNKSVASSNDNNPDSGKLNSPIDLPVTTVTGILPTAASDLDGKLSINFDKKKRKNSSTTGNTLKKKGPKTSYNSSPLKNQNISTIPNKKDVFSPLTAQPDYRINSTSNYVDSPKSSVNLSALKDLNLSPVKNAPNSINSTSNKNKKPVNNKIIGRDSLPENTSSLKKKTSIHEKVQSKISLQSFSKKKKNFNPPNLISIYPELSNILTFYYENSNSPSSTFECLKNGSIFNKFAVSSKNLVAVSLKQFSPQRETQYVPQDKPLKSHDEFPKPSNSKTKVLLNLFKIINAGKPNQKDDLDIPKSTLRFLPLGQIFPDHPSVDTIIDKSNSGTSEDDPEDSCKYSPSLWWSPEGDYLVTCSHLGLLCIYSETYSPNKWLPIGSYDVQSPISSLLWISPRRKVFFISLTFSN